MSGEENILAGTMLDEQYEIRGVISSGGWGKVYKARQIAFDRVVAVKVLHPSMMDDATAIGRFKREAKAASQIQNPHIAAVYDHGVLENNSPYLVMQFFEGEDLATYLREREKLSAEEAIPIFLQLCDALSAVHKNEIVHRDIKPSNILICPGEDGMVEAKLIDFGLVGMMQNACQDMTKLTQTGLTLGTAEYMSPEQCIGNAVDQRSDIYSLGCTMYECLSGVQPFYADDIMVCMHKHLTGKVAPLTVAADDDVLAKQLADVVNCSLELQPENRFQTIDELANELRLCMTKESKVKHRPKSASQPTLQVAVMAPPKPKPVKALVGIACGALCVALIFAFNSARVPSPAISNTTDPTLASLVGTVKNGRKDALIRAYLGPDAYKAHWTNEDQFEFRIRGSGEGVFQVSTPYSAFFDRSVNLTAGKTTTVDVNLREVSVDFCVDEVAQTDNSPNFLHAEVQHSASNFGWVPLAEREEVMATQSIDGSLKFSPRTVNGRICDLGPVQFPFDVRTHRCPLAVADVPLIKGHVYFLSAKDPPARHYTLLKVTDVR